MKAYLRRIGWIGALQAVTLLALAALTRHPDVDRTLAVVLALGLGLVFVILCAIRLRP